MKKKMSKVLNILEKAEQTIRKERNKKKTFGGKGTVEFLLNKIKPIPRFGFGIYDGYMYRGINVQTDSGDIIPAVVTETKELLYGDELKTRGIKFRFIDNLHEICSYTLPNEMLYNWINKKENSLDTAILFKEIRNRCVNYYGSKDDRVYDVVTSLILSANVFILFDQFGRTLITGLQGSGKSTLTQFIEKLIPNPISSFDSSDSFVFRSVEVSGGAVIIDNFDNKTDEEKARIINLYDCSYSSQSAVGRSDKNGRKLTPTRFRTYCPMIVNSINMNWLKPSSISRTIFIHAEKISDKGRKELPEKDTDEFRYLRYLTSIWAFEKNNIITKKIAEKIGSDKFDARDYQVAKPLLIIAKMAGEEYYQNVLGYLKQNFEEYHKEDAFSDNMVLFQAIWDITEDQREQKQTELKVAVSDLARITLSTKGVDEITNDKQNPYFKKIHHKECMELSKNLRIIPYTKITNPKNRTTFVFDKLRIVTFFKEHGFIVESEQATLGGVEV